VQDDLIEGVIAKNNIRFVAGNAGITRSAFKYCRHKCIFVLEVLKTVDDIVVLYKPFKHNKDAFLTKTPVLTIAWFGNNKKLALFRAYYELSTNDAIELGRCLIYHATYRDAASSGFVRSTYIIQSVYHVKEQGWEFIGLYDVGNLHWEYHRL
ncbi:21572_t:CDS:2, partial [Dentiscutata erythropus]